MESLLIVSPKWGVYWLMNSKCPVQLEVSKKQYLSHTIVLLTEAATTLGSHRAMKITSYNCQGLGILSIVGRLRRLCSSYTPNILFLMETRSSDDRMASIKVTLSFKLLFVVWGINGDEGLAYCWDDTISLQLLSFLADHVDFSIT